MRLSRVRGLLLVVAVVVAAVGVGLWASHGSASAQAPTISTITTELQPGWNMVGWMGSDTTTGEIFDAVPALQVVAAWDEDTERYIWARRGGAVPPELEPLTRGRALFLWLGGTGTVQWSRPASAEGMLLSLPPGYSLVGWAGLDETPLSEAVGRFGDALVSASWWDAETQSYGRYEPGADEPAGGLPLLNHGDALWVELSEEARWWQSGTARTRFVFRGGVTTEYRSAIRAEMERVVTFFAERYGLEPPDFYVLVDPSLQVAGSASPGRITVGRRYPLAHEYFHILQFHLSQRSPSAHGSPTWMTEGTATYAERWYLREKRNASGVGFSWARWQGFAEITESLHALEDSRLFRDTGLSGYDLGASAVDWLVKHAAGLPADFRFAPWEPGGLDGETEYDAYIQYYRLLASSESWDDAFEGAFGIATDDFYEAFAEYRKLHLPHLADDRDEPILVLLGEVPADTAADVRADFRALQAFFRDRLGTGPADYTVWVAADAQSAEPAELSVYGQDPPPGGACAGQAVYFGAFATLACYDRLAGRLATVHFYGVRERLAPWRSLPPPPDGYERWGPRWLRVATIAYMREGAEVVMGVARPDGIRNRAASVAGGTSLPLRSMETEAGIDGVPRDVAEALGFLAADWLAQRVGGERALFEYYRLLPTSDSWREAFTKAFRIGVEEFYAAFEEYRGEIVSPLPHLADDRDEPILVLVGEVSPEAAEPYRTQLRVLQALFSDRFRTDPADYTLYVAADSELAAAEYARALGRELEYFSCGQGRTGVLFIQVAGCSISPDPIVELHHDVVVRQLVSPAHPGSSQLGPSWLQYATRSYTGSTYLAVTGVGTVEEIRSRLRIMAARTEHPLPSAFQQVDDAAQALGFLAADWLAQRAGEPALFEYYRLLPSSDSWQDAFEGAFGITIDDFYDEFAKYRAAGFDS